VIFVSNVSQIIIASVNLENVGVFVMVCKRGHGKNSQIKLPKQRKLFCDYILAYRQKEGVGGNALFCGDLPIGERIPKEYVAVGGTIID
jgi:hypothetical protein